MVFCMHNICTMSSCNIVHDLLLDNGVDLVAEPCHGQLYPILSAWYSVPPNLLELSFRCLILSFEQQGPRAEEKEVWPLALDCCRIFSTVPLAPHTKLGSLVIHVDTPPDMPQEHIHKACGTYVFRLVIYQVTVPSSSTCILPMFFMAVLRQVKGQYNTFAASVFSLHEVVSVYDCLNS